jgi:hypothetical protein
MDKERNMASCSFGDEEWLACLLGRVNRVSGVGFHEETGRITTVKMEDSPLVEGKRFKIED